MVKELNFEPERKSPKEASPRKRKYDAEYSKSKYHDDPETRERVKRQARERSKKKRKEIQERQNQLRALKRKERTSKGSGL